MLAPTLLDVATILCLPLGAKEVQSAIDTTFPKLNYVFRKNGGTYSTFLDANSKASCKVSDFEHWTFLMYFLASISMAPAL